MWIQTYTGTLFTPLEPKPADIHIEDIAHSLSLQCRFTGHCKEFYSVAQHSYLVSLICEDPKWGLMHDASEAYLADVARPIKNSIPDLLKAEEGLQKAIAERFGLSWPMPECLDLADNQVLLAEKRDLLVSSPESWPLEEMGIDPMPEKVEPISWAKSLFLKRYKDLFLEDVRTWHVMEPHAMDDEKDEF
jgi:hypothetical protein